MTEPTPRKRFQFHLSTAIVMMFVAGGLIWANVRTYSIQVFFMGGTRDDRGNFHQDYAIYKAHGWPMMAYRENHTNPEYNDTGGQGLQYLNYDSPIPIVLLNFAAGVLIVVGTLFICERQIRRRAALMCAQAMRKHFQFHRSTAIVLIFVTGGLIWANVVDPRGTADEDLRQCHSYRGFSDLPESLRMGSSNHGWPYCAVFYSVYSQEEDPMFKPIRHDYEVSYSLILLDAAFALLILITTWFLCGWLIRRRAARK